MRARFAVGLAALCAAVALLAAVAGAVQAAPSHPFLFMIKKFVPAPNVIEFFEDPCGLAVDNTGDIYVSDYYHDKVDVFSSGGSLLTQLSGVEPLDGPCGLAVDASGKLFVNVFHRRVTRFTPAAFPIGSKTAYGAGTTIDEAHPTGVAYDSVSGHVYVDQRTQVAVYEPSGAPVEEAGEPVLIGSGSSSVDDAYGVAVSAFPGTEGYVYVADAANGKIEVFNPATSVETPVQEIDGAGTPQGGFTTLRDAALAIDKSTGHLFVSYNAQGLLYEHPLGAVAEFNAAGEYRGTLPAPTPLWFGEPSGIAVDNSATATAGRVYVTTGNSQVENETKSEEGSIYAFGPSTAGQRLEVAVSGAGEGAVSSSPAGISCPEACAAEYDEGVAVTLTAKPAAGSAFASWTGCDSEPAGNCRVTMSGAKSVDAEFEVAPPPLAAGGSSGGGAGIAGPISAAAALATPGGSSAAGAAPGAGASARAARQRRLERRRKARHREALRRAAQRRAQAKRRRFARQHPHVHHRGHVRRRSR